VVFVEHPRDRQPPAERNPRLGQLRPGAELGQQPSPAAAERQQQAEGAAAEGAEESSAPQAWRCV